MPYKACAKLCYALPSSGGCLCELFATLQRHANTSYGEVQALSTLVARSMFIHTQTVAICVHNEDPHVARVQVQLDTLSQP